MYDAPLEAGDQRSQAQHATSGTARAAWSSAGNGILNTRHQPLEHHIDRESVRKLGIQWTYQAEGELMGTPSVDDKTVYITDAVGNITALTRATGGILWKRRVADYTGHADDFARVTPAMDEDALYLGNQAGRDKDVGATVFAVDKKTGNKLWATKVDAHPAAITTQSPVVYRDRVYVGVSSWEEYRSTTPYECCSFRGSVVALDRASGEIVWKFWTTPDPKEVAGYTGVSVWGSTPVVDASRGSLYITTGNNYTVPQSVLDCQALPSEQIATCMAEVPGAQDNHFDSIVALDLERGTLKWAHRASKFDSFNGSCLMPGSTECTKPFGEDEDFAQGAMLYTTLGTGSNRQLLAAGQKNGIFWSLDPDTGAVVWRTQVGPGGLLGGFEWGSASDGQRIYGAIANSDGKPWSFPSGESVRSGFWAGIDASTGKVVWQTRGVPATNASSRGSVSTANGVVFAGSFDASGLMYAFDGTTGDTLWAFASGGGTLSAAPAIVDGTVYWGSRKGKLYAFQPVSMCSSCVPTPDPSLIDPSSTISQNSWRAIYSAYLGAGTVGHCSNCHAEMTSATSAYEFLVTKGQIDGFVSRIVTKGQSILTWFGGRMPPDGPVSYPEAAADMGAWIEAGARND